MLQNYVANITFFIILSLRHEGMQHAGIAGQAHVSKCLVIQHLNVMNRQCVHFCWDNQLQYLQYRLERYRHRVSPPGRRNISSEHGLTLRWQLPLCAEYYSNISHSHYRILVSKNDAEVGCRTIRSRLDVALRVLGNSATLMLLR